MNDEVQECNRLNRLKIIGRAQKNPSTIAGANKTPATPYAAESAANEHPSCYGTKG